MALEEFKTCAAKNLGDQVDAWDEVVVQNIIAVGRWFKSLDSTVQYVVGGILGLAGASAMALLAKAVGLAAAEIALPILAAFAVGVGVGAGLIVIVECADEAAM